MVISFKVDALDAVERRVRQGLSSLTDSARSVEVRRNWRGDGASLTIDVVNRDGTFSLVFDTFGRHPDHGAIRAYVSPLSCSPLPDFVAALRDVDASLGFAITDALSGTIRGFQKESWWDGEATKNLMFALADSGFAGYWLSRSEWSHE